MFAEHIKSNLEDYFIIEERDELLLYQKIIYVPPKARKSIISYYHNNQLAGEHFGIDKTIKKISQEYYFPEM